MEQNLNNIGRLDGRVAIVTGGARGIGRAAAELMAHFGAKIAIADMNLELATKTAEEISQSGAQAKAFVLDVTDQASVEAMVLAVEKAFSRIDILVNSAGVLDKTLLPDMTVEKWNFVIDVDLRGTHLCSQAVMPIMFRQGAGKIINLASQAGQLGGMFCGINYTAAKGGVIAMTKGYARWCAQHGVTVNCVSPGLIATEMTAGRGDDPNSVPLKRLGTALDCAKAIYFLASDLSDYITGTSVDVNGGFLMR